jgi:hypothetical protein
MSEFLNDNKMYKMARDMYDKYFKSSGMTFDQYYLQIKDQLNIYYSLPDEDKRKFLDTRMMLLGKAEREIEKIKRDVYKMKDKK